MSNKPNDLEALWHQQTVSTVDSEQLQKQWKILRFKQYFYLLMDISSVLALPIIVYLFPKELSTFEFVWFSFVFVLVFVMFLCIVWMRRYSLGFKVDAGNTNEFVERFRLQYKQNIRIAYWNKILCFVTPLIFMLYLVVAYFGEYVQPDVLIKKAKLLMGMSAVCMPLLWIWASKREQKFKKRLAEFEAQWDVQNSAVG